MLVTLPASARSPVERRPLAGRQPAPGEGEGSSSSPLQVSNSWVQIAWLPGPAAPRSDTEGHLQEDHMGASQSCLLLLGRPWHLSSITCKVGTGELEAPSDMGDRWPRVLRTDSWDFRYLTWQVRLWRSVSSRFTCSGGPTSLPARGSHSGAGGTHARSSGITGISPEY